MNEIVVAKNPHDLDPTTGNCLVCGASREELDDNLAPDCPRFNGHLHAVALIALSRTIAKRHLQLECARRHLRFQKSLGYPAPENFVADRAASLRGFEADLKSLEASLEVLKALP